MRRNLCASFSFVDHPDFGVDTFFIERNLSEQGFSSIAGVDEAGRGPLAGPVVAGCVVLPQEGDHSCFKDSKKLSPRQREKLFTVLQSSRARIGVGIVSSRKIEEINILQASLLAMQRAIEDCLPEGLPDFLLVDGTFSVPISLSQQPLVKGESKSASIAAASIIAKVTRDHLMAEAHEQFPEYNFIKNQGYPTKEHRQAIAEFGPCVLHRRTFKGVKEYFPELKQKNEAIQQQRLWPG
jgi:ribonuclease HII